MFFFSGLFVDGLAHLRVEKKKENSKGRVKISTVSLLNYPFYYRTLLEGNK